jgi:hypothetical protein
MVPAWGRGGLLSRRMNRWNPSMNPMIRSADVARARAVRGGGHRRHVHRGGAADPPVAAGADRRHPAPRARGRRAAVRCAGAAGAALTAAGREPWCPGPQAALAAFADGKRAVAEVAGLAAGEVRVGGGATAVHVPPAAGPGRGSGAARPGHPAERSARATPTSSRPADRRRLASTWRSSPSTATDRPAGPLARLGRPRRRRADRRSPRPAPIARTAPWVTFAPGLADPGACSSSGLPGRRRS